MHCASLVHKAWLTAAAQKIALVLYKHRHTDSRQYNAWHTMHDMHQECGPRHIRPAFAQLNLKGSSASAP